MTTFALALVFVGLLVLYCGLKSYSVKDALLGHAVPTSSGSLLG